MDLVGLNPLALRQGCAVDRQLLVGYTPLQLQGLEA